jgi:hypothetical protein
MATVRELKSTEFTERLEPIFRSVESRLPEHLRGRKAEYFFPHWRHLMELGVARTWELSQAMEDGDGNAWGDACAVIGLFIVPDIFSGDSVASVPFWFSLPGTTNTLLLLGSIERAARDAKCKRISIAAFDTLEGERVAKIYDYVGYSQTERTFQKEL